MTTHTYELRKAHGGTIYEGDHSAEVLRLVGRQRPGRMERRVFRLVIRRPGETATHTLVRERDGSVQVESVIWRSGGSLLEILARVEQSTPPTSTGRTIWERLLDPWPVDEPRRAENLLSATELAAFSRWDPFTGTAGGDGP